LKKDNIVFIIVALIVGLLGGYLMWPLLAEGYLSGPGVLQTTSSES
jgi:hypothetical protein